MTKTVIVCGAGATLADAKLKTRGRRPPLDVGFFKYTQKLGFSEFRKVADYLQSQFGIEVTNPREDSLERVMAVLYADVQNPAAPSAEAADAYRTFLSLINRRIATGTNPLSPTNKSCLYRLLRRLVHNHRISPSDISIITFNYDLHVERTLDSLNSSSTLQRYQPIMKFPQLYRLHDNRISRPPKSTPVFPQPNGVFAGIEVLKLHGSLNWFSIHNRKDPPLASLIERDIQFWITPRVQVDVDMKFTEKGKKKFTFPIVGSSSISVGVRALRSRFR